MRPGDASLIKEEPADDSMLDNSWNDNEVVVHTFQKKDFNRVAWYIFLDSLNIKVLGEVLSVDVEMRLDSVVRRTDR